MSFKGKSVLVTGASSGIGAAIAKKIAAEGANVAIVGRNEAKLKTVEEQISAIGNKPLVIIADMTKDEDLDRIIRDAVQYLGSIDVLVNNAGVGGNTSVLQENVIEVFDKVISTNFRSVVYLTNIAAPHLIASKGNIINISSIAGIKAYANLSIYCSSKAALDMFTKCVASELGVKGVRVNCINPGPVDTDIMANSGYSKEQSDELWNYLKNNTTLNRVSDPEEIADLALFLASDKAKGITGSLFVTDNGSLVKTS